MTPYRELKALPQASPLARTGNASLQKPLGSHNPELLATPLDCGEVVMMAVAVVAHRVLKVYCFVADINS